MTPYQTFLLFVSTYAPLWVNDPRDAVVAARKCPPETFYARTDAEHRAFTFIEWYGRHTTTRPEWVPDNVEPMDPNS